MTRGHALTTGLAAGLVVGVTLSGCGRSSDHQDARAAAPTPAASSAVVASPTVTSALPPPPAVPWLPNQCTNVLTTAELNTILGHRLDGTTELIRGVPQPAIGRLGRMTCRYGVGALPGGPAGSAAATPGTTAATGAVPIEIALSTYRDPDSASQRVNATIHDQEAAGAKATDATVLDLDGVLLSSPDTALLVLSYGSTTLALSIDPRVVPTGQTGRVAAAIGKAVLRNISADGRPLPTGALPPAGASVSGSSASG